MAALAEAPGEMQWSVQAIPLITEKNKDVEGGRYV